MTQQQSGERCNKCRKIIDPAETPFIRNDQVLCKECYSEARPEREQCQNCDALIGRMEEAFLWQERVVCSGCYQKLSRQTPPPSQDKFPERIKQSTWNPLKAALHPAAQKYAEEREEKGKSFLQNPLFLIALFLLFLVGLLVNASTGNAGLLMCATVVLFGALWYVVLVLPIGVARDRNHRNLEGVRNMTYLSILIPPLWLIALVWAFIGETE
jgi:hypothetical protein